MNSRRQRIELVLQKKGHVCLFIKSFRRTLKSKHLTQQTKSCWKHFSRPMPKKKLKNNTHSLQSRHYFGERSLKYFLSEIMAAIVYFNDSGRLGRDGVGRRSKIRVGVGVGEICIFFKPSPPPSPTASISKSNIAG